MNSPARQEELNPTTVRRALGLEYENNFVYLLAEGTRGGILLAARESILQLQNSAITQSLSQW
jgi:hypothetical protein